MAGDKFDWTGIRHTNKRGYVLSSREVTDVLAVKVKGARYRLATISGFFQVANIPNPFTLKGGEMRVEVVCYWNGKRPAAGKDWIHLKIKNNYELILGYSGMVVNDIGATPNKISKGLIKRV